MSALRRRDEALRRELQLLVVVQLAVDVHREHRARERHPVEAPDCVGEQRERLELRLSSMETRLLAQFNAMDSLVANLSSTSSFLTGQLANLPGVVRES